VNVQQQIEALQTEVESLGGKAGQLDEYKALRKKQQEIHEQVEALNAKIQPFIADAEEIQILFKGKQQILAKLEKVRASKLKK